MGNGGTTHLRDLKKGRPWNITVGGLPTFGEKAEIGGLKIRDTPPAMLEKGGLVCSRDNV